jgi:hypothetical protein
MLAGHLEKAGIPAISGPNTLVLRFAPRYNSEREYCQEPARVERVEEVMRQITGQPCQLRIETPATPGGTAPPADSGGDAGSPPRSRQKRADAAHEPLVKRAIDVLGAQVVHVDDGFGSAPADRPADTEEA